MLLALCACVAAFAKAPGPRVVPIVARDYVFIVPDTIDAGSVIFAYRNAGKESHEALLRRIPAEHTVNEVFSALADGGALPEWLEPAGGPNVLGPGREVRIREDLKPGTYVWLCFIATPDRIAHIRKGMVRALVVRPAKAAHTVPARAAATVEMKDFAYSVPQLHAGKQWLRVRNAGKKAHELVIWELAPGTSLADALSWQKSSGKPRPFTQIGGVGALAPGTDAFVELNVRRGKYVFRCRIEDSETRQTHFQLGMQSEITVL